ncbi:MAG: tRNA (N6-isopentenyl adenosine(37)-C2)-methylthiotransferase MiaB [Candidatus Omnitrophica bacterium]|nr:tRNA (N6-isopentenyl adenosine(37)-C2)-methylthiotransferase MiaB [Candidatus Omnitrophota bacterium]
MGKKICILTFGCQMNERDSEVLMGLLRNKGFVFVDAPTEADVVIFNTCSVRKHAEDKVFSEIGRVVKQTRYSKKNLPLAKSDTYIHKKPYIGVVGCMAQLYKEKIFERSPLVDFVVGPSDIEKIPALLERFFSSEKTTTGSQLYTYKIWYTEGNKRSPSIYHTKWYNDKSHFYVVISEGCSKFCSYCVVPYTRGPLRHRDYRDILREIKQAIDIGLKRLTLLGQNVSSYVYLNSFSPDKCVTFTDLLEIVNGLEGLDEISFITSHPGDTTVSLFETMRKCQKVKKYLHLPVQSGSNKILERMNRGYTKEFYLELVKKYRDILPEGVLTTDIIVGFPGETERDFDETYQLVKQVRFDAAYIFKYSPRPYTQAATFIDDVPEDEKKRRHTKILALQKKISLAKKQGQRENR